MLIPCAIDAVLGAAEKWAPAIAGVVLASKGATWAAGLGVAAAVISLVRGLMQQASTHPFRRRFVNGYVDALARRSSIDGSIVSAERVASRFIVGTSAATNLVIRTAPALCGELLALVLVLPLAWKIVTPAFLLVAAPVAGLGIGAALVLRRAIARVSDATWRTSQTFFEEISILLGGHTELTAAARLEHQVRIVHEKAGDWSQSVQRTDLVSTAGGRFPVAVIAAGAVLVAWIWLRDRPHAFVSTLAEGLVLGGLVSIAASIGRSVLEAERTWRDVVALGPMLERALSPRPAVDGERVAAPCPIRMRSVTFAYPGSAHATPALCCAALEWNPLEKMAIAGPNGSGKSTLLKLLLRLADPVEGVIEARGVDLRTIDLAAWRSSISYLPQRPFLPSRGTIREAIQWLGGADESHVLDHLDALGLLGSLSARSPKDPLLVPVEALSAGERQKVALARALSSHAPMWLLDEPDTHLDAAGVAYLARVVRESEGRSILVVAHDPTLLHAAERVVHIGKRPSCAPERGAA